MNNTEIQDKRLEKQIVVYSHNGTVRWKSQQTLSVRGQTVNISVFASHVVSITITQLRHCSTNIPYVMM